MNAQAPDVDHWGTIEGTLIEGPNTSWLGTDEQLGAQNESGMCIWDNWSAEEGGRKSRWALSAAACLMEDC